MSMLEEYTERFNKTHKCASVLEKCLDLYDPSLFPSDKTTPLPLCMPEEFKSDDVVDSYRRFYSSKPRMRYPKSKIPAWFAFLRKEEFVTLEDK